MNFKLLIILIQNLYFLFIMGTKIINYYLEFFEIVNIFLAHLINFHFHLKLYFNPNNFLKNYQFIYQNNID